MEQFYIYLWSISENVAISLGNISISLLIITPFLFPLLYEFSDMTSKEVLPVVKRTAISGLILLFIAILIPSKQDLALLFMYPYIKQGTETVIKSETLNKMKTMTNLYLDEQIKNLKEHRGGNDNL